MCFPEGGKLCVLNMTSIDSTDNQQISLDVATGNSGNLRSCVSKVTSVIASIGRYTLDKWFTSENPISGNKHISDGNNILTGHYEMPRKLDWNLFKRIYDIHPENYEQLISIHGVGPATVRALSLIGELIYGTSDPVKYNFAHGGKDGVPYPVAREVYDKSIKYLSSAIEGADIERIDRIQALADAKTESDGSIIVCGLLCFQCTAFLHFIIS
jgi:hypothetical protein